MASRDQASVPTTSSDNFKDRTQTSLSEDAHDMATAAERKTNEAIDRVKEVRVPYVLRDWYVPAWHPQWVVWVNVVAG